MSKHRSRQHARSFQPTRRQVLQGAGGLAAMAALGSPATHRAMAQDSAVAVDFWNWWDVGRQPLMDSIIAGFQEEFPDITVNNVPQTWDRRDEVVTTALAGGDPPEIIMASRQEIVKFADSGALAPITQFVKDAGIDPEAYYPSEINSMWWKDELYALPMPTAGGETGLYFYNTTLFEEAGLDAEAPPETWDELDAAAEKLTKRTSDGALEQVGANLFVSNLVFLAQLYTNNGTFLSDDLKTVTFNSDQGVETLQWLLDFSTKHHGGHQNYLDWVATINTGEDPFHQQRLGIQFQNVSQFFHLKNKAPDVKYSVHFRPYNSNNPDAASHGVAAMSFGWGYVIPSSLDPAVQEAAFKFVQRITWDEEGAATFMLEQERPSPLIAFNENPAYTELNPHWDKVLTALENDISIGIVPVQGEMFTTLKDYVDLVAFEEMSPKDGLDAAAEEAQGILDDYWSSQS
ncbi:MAG TPA: ABC transporter substrate-binding protein [Thermomicrobiales bacterium]|nr:ABC transporter substrate-binding protein [Thermomicrobiales bacterium]